MCWYAAPCWIKLNNVLVEFKKKLWVFVFLLWGCFSNWLILTLIEFDPLHVCPSLHIVLPLISLLFHFICSHGSYSKLSCGTMLTMCLHTFILFWLTETSVSVVTCQVSVCSFIFVFRLETSSFFIHIFLYSCSILLSWFPNSF